MGIHTSLEKLDTFSYENGIGIRKDITFGLTQDEIKVYNGIHDTASQRSYRENAMKDRYPQYADGTIWDAPKVFDSNVQTALNKLSTVSKLMDPIYLNMLDDTEFGDLVKEAEANGAMDIITNAPTDGSVSFEQYVCDNLSDNPATGKMAYQVYMDEWLDDRFYYGEFAGPSSNSSTERRDLVESIQAMYNGELTPEIIDENGLFTEKLQSPDNSGAGVSEQDAEPVEESETGDGVVAVEEKESNIDKSFWNDIKVNISVAMLSLQNWFENSGFGEWFSKTVNAIEDKLDDMFDKKDDENSAPHEETPSIQVPSDSSDYTEPPFDTPDALNAIPPFGTNTVEPAFDVPDALNVIPPLGTNTAGSTFAEYHDDAVEQLHGMQATTNCRVAAAESLLSSYSSDNQDDVGFDTDSV